MAVLPKSVGKVIEELERLPGIGPKSAARMTYFLLRAPKERSNLLAESILKMREETVTCTSCFNIADKNPCSLCSDPVRDSTRLCVVEEPLDVVALEHSGVYEGRYFVLGGVVSPAEGIGPEQLRFAELKTKVKELLEKGKDEVARVSQQVTVRDTPSVSDSSDEKLEIIIATNPSLEGEATASYIVEILTKNTSWEGNRLSISRLAMGLPTGADLEYADRLTLKRSLENRTLIRRY